MGKLLALVGTTLGSAVGWWLGAPAGLMTAFVCSMVGFGVGLYAGRRIAREYLPSSCLNHLNLRWIYTSWIRK